MMTDDGGKSYSEEEFALILQKAAELQTRTPGSSSVVRRDGMDLGEIKQIASEVGIDPKFIDRAAALAVRGKVERPSFLVGSPLKYRQVIDVPAVFSEREMAEVVELARHAMGSRGEVSELFDAVEWSSSSAEMAVAHVTVAPGDSETRVSVQVDQTNAAAMSFLLSGLVGMVAAVAVGDALTPGWLGGFGIVGTGLTGAWAVGRTILGQLNKRTRERIESMIEEISRFGDDGDEEPDL